MQEISKSYLIRKMSSDELESEIKRIQYLISDDIVTQQDLEDLKLIKSCYLQITREELK